MYIMGKQLRRRALSRCGPFPASSLPPVYDGLGVQERGSSHFAVHRNNTLEYLDDCRPQCTPSMDHLSLAIGHIPGLVWSPLSRKLESLFPPLIETDMFHGNQGVRQDEINSSEHMHLRPCPRPSLVSLPNRRDSQHP